MQYPIDDHLTQIATMPMPASSHMFEADVFAAIDEHMRSAAAGRRVRAWSIGAALALGVIGGTSLGGTPGRAEAASPIGIDGALAPSTLLLGR